METLTRFTVASRLLIYGQYCSHMEHAQKTLDDLIATREEVKCKVEVNSLTLPRPSAVTIRLISFISSLEPHASPAPINQPSRSSAQAAHRCHLVLISLMPHRSGVTLER